MSKPGLGSDFWQFLKEHKWWWLTPVLLTVILLLVLFATTDDSPLAPFIYSLS
ncbi:MAG: hypothetical protein KDD47_17410 [Acidobacteria bacterium]|nr:hypothetical protein [Acidobacteriota bacterium]